MPFSPGLNTWLTANASFVNDTFSEDLQGCRSLGPASGTLWDAYPFLHGCQYSGIFAGLSLSGVLSSDTDVCIVEYSSQQGFFPANVGPFSGDDWQELTSDQWQQIKPSLYPPIAVPPPVHPVDLKVRVGDQVFDTSVWRYKSIQLSNKYRQHSWIGEGMCLVAVTFVDRPEHIEPFLRPRFIAGESAKLDPHCLYSLNPSSRLFDGRVAMIPGTQIDLAADGAANNAVVTITKNTFDVKYPVVRTISGIEANTVGNFACCCDDCCRFTQECEETDPVSSLVKLTKHQIFIQNTCGPCCHCAEYIADYEKLRELNALQSALVEDFNRMYADSVVLRDKVEEILRKRLQLVQIHLGEWGEDDAGFYCVFFVSVSATRTNATEGLLPPSSLILTFLRGGSPLAITSARITTASASLPVRLAMIDGNLGVRLENVKPAYVGTKTLPLRVRFQQNFDTAAFDASEIKMTVTNGDI